MRGTPHDLSDAPYPLVIFAHGGNTVRFLSSWLCEHVASYGFVVMAIDYADSWRFDPTVDGRLQAISRPLDVRWEIDFAQLLTSAGREMEGMIDTEHVAIMGHSYGGYTAYMAAGARMASFDSPTGWCSLYSYLPVPVEAGPVSRCLSPAQVRQFEAAYVQDAGLSAVPDGLWPSLGDARVDAMVALAPSVAEFDAEGTRYVKIPVMVVSGSEDRWVLSDNPLFRQYAYENLGSAQKALALLEGADHMIFHNSCHEIPWLIDVGAFFACSDPVWDMDRAHDLTNHFATAFLLATLKGDTDAAAALAPDAVSFPGITYEEQGF